jgi:flagellar protein FlbD
MIPVTRPDGTSLLVNPDRIETIEETPDTIILMVDGRRLLVRETATEVAERFVAYHRALRSESRFGGRRRTDPPASGDPANYEHPNRAGIRVAPRNLEHDAQ